MFVHHPTSAPARELVGGRIVDFDDDGAAEVTLPHVLEHYRAAGYQLTATTGDGAAEFDASSAAYRVECPVCGAQPGVVCTTGEEPRVEPHKRRESAAEHAAE